MGRTKRKRARKTLLVNDDPNTNIINLQTWLSGNNWKNPSKLKIKHFPRTGRGVTSTIPLNKNDILITVPYDLMITFSTIQTHLLENNVTLEEKLSIQDLLSLFLSMEKDKPESRWRFYLDTLPRDLPRLPWLEPLDELELYPLDLRSICEKNLESFKVSNERTRRSIRSSCVPAEDLFKWAYVMVNTRAVYVNPNLVPESKDLFLLDEPASALCPFLDMFNHHFTANVEAELKVQEGRLVYQLRTLKEFRRHRQIFISYGGHDNETLLTQYGFFIPGNTFDTIKLQLPEVLKLLKLNVDSKQFSFIKGHEFDKELYVGFNGASFNLKAVLYTGYVKDLKGISSVVFSENYPMEFKVVIKGYLKVLLDDRRDAFLEDYERLESKGTGLVFEYVKYKLELVDFLANTLLGD